MQQSWLLCYLLLIVVATNEALSHNHETEPSIEVVSSVLGQKSPTTVFILHDAVTPRAIGKGIGFERLLNRVTNPTSGSVKRDAPALRTPRPTAAPSLRKRQDDGQIQALSAQLQSLSQSATQAISSVSSSASSILSQMSQSAQSIRQSAEQAAQSADQARRELSQTQSSASSAVSAANARASDQISQSLASMSSRISVNLASAQSSASNAISSARVAASQFAASQIQAIQAGATGNTGSTNPPVNQTQSNSVSASNVAIITTVSVVGTAILSTVASCFVLRYRRARKSARGGEAQEGNNDKSEKLVAVRGSPSPRFPRFGGSSRSPINEFRLPSLSPMVQSKKAQREVQDNIGSATSDYSDRENKDSRQSASDVDRNQSSSFRFQKNNGVSSATTVRLIRVNSEKSKGGSPMVIRDTATEPVPPLPAVTAPDKYPKMTPAFTSNKPTTRFPSETNIITQPPKAKRPPAEEQRVSVRSTQNSDTETPGWRLPIRLTTMTQNRFNFRDSSDMESGEPTPTNPDIPSPPPIPDTPNLRTQRPAGPQAQVSNRAAGFGRTAPGRPKNARNTFATFPRIRNEPERESMINRGRPSLNGRSIRPSGGEERRQGEPAEVGDNGSDMISTTLRRDTLNNR
ncbi:hypothetical protein GGR58DRAFT_410539 [Xylaria digitata]|nr:hypothetical protein GGR58DRAFT_410539 [Xylaria digitata]